MGDSISRKLSADLVDTKFTCKNRTAIVRRSIKKETTARSRRLIKKDTTNQVRDLD